MWLSVCVGGGRVDGRGGGASVRVCVCAGVSVHATLCVCVRAHVCVWSHYSAM